jgi:hypothetical protein
MWRALLFDADDFLVRATLRVGVNAGANAHVAAVDEIAIKHEIESFIVSFRGMKVKFVASRVFRER